MEVSSFFHKVSRDFPIFPGLFDEVQADLRRQRLVPAGELQHLQLRPLHRGLWQRRAAGAEGVGRRRARGVARGVARGIARGVARGRGARGIHHLAWRRLDGLEG